MAWWKRKSENTGNAKQNPIGSSDKFNNSLLDLQYAFPVQSFIRRLELPGFTNHDRNVAEAADNSQHQKNKGAPRRCLKSSIQINPHSLV